MHEYDSPVPGQDEIWLAGQVSCVKAVPQSGAMQLSPQGQFRLRILAADPSHSLGALLGGEKVRHGMSTASTT